MISNETSKRYKKIENFLMKKDFNGFTKKDLFIMSIIKKGWGQDIAALSHMAESMVNLSIIYPSNKQHYIYLINEIIKRAIHPKVNPYRKNIFTIDDLGKYGYYLEHLNIILGCFLSISDSEKYRKLNKKISFHLLLNSESYNNFHADLLPHVNMKWSADQSAILYSLWLYDKNHGADISSDLIAKWTDYMNNYGTHKKTGLYITEVLGTRKYSKQPRGCSHSYMIHYMSKFDKKNANRQWRLYKKYMMKKILGRIAFREYLSDYNGRMTPDTGPIIAGCGIAATGLGLNAASSMNDMKIFRGISKTMSPFGSVFQMAEGVVGNNLLTRIGTDLLASSIWLNAETKQKWFS